AMRLQCSQCLSGGCSLIWRSGRQHMNRFTMDAGIFRLVGGSNRVDDLHCSRSHALIGAGHLRLETGERRITRQGESARDACAESWLTIVEASGEQINRGRGGEQ